MGNIHVTMVGKFPAHQPFTWNHMDNGGKMLGKWGISTIVGKFRGEIVGIFKIKGRHFL